MMSELMKALLISVLVLGSIAALVACLIWFDRDGVIGYGTRDRLHFNCYTRAEMKCSDEEECEEGYDIRDIDIACRKREWNQCVGRWR